MGAPCARLRRPFLFDRSLYGELSRIAYSSTRDFLRREAAGTFRGVERAVPAMVASPQSFGDLIVHNPHLHACVSLGLFRPDDVFLPLEDVDFSGLEEIFRERFFRMMLRREMVRPETVERMRAWEHSGFAVNFDRKLEAYGRCEQTGTSVSAKLRPDPSGSRRIERGSRASSRTWSALLYPSADSPIGAKAALSTTRAPVSTPGAAVLALGAVCENRRERLMGKLRSVAAMLETWNEVDARR